MIGNLQEPEGDTDQTQEEQQEHARYEQASARLQAMSDLEFISRIGESEEAEQP